MKKYIAISLACLLCALFIVLIYVIAFDGISISSSYKDHPHSLEKKIISYGTCESKGKIAYYCSVCDRNIHIEATEKGDHSFTEKVITKATCTEAGSKKLTCKYCDYSCVEEIEVAGHKYNSKTIIEATCTTAGSKEKVCSQCGDVKVETIEPEHKFLNDITPATCTRAGSKIMTCRVCGYKITQEIKKEGHKFVNGECVNCDAYKASEIIPDTWYTYKLYSSLSAQNALVIDVDFVSIDYIWVDYYPVCSNCHVVGSYYSFPATIYSISEELHHCSNCGASTYSRLKLE